VHEKHENLSQIFQISQLGQNDPNIQIGRNEGVSIDRSGKNSRLGRRKVGDARKKAGSAAENLEQLWGNLGSRVGNAARKAVAEEMCQKVANRDLNISKKTSRVA
jgi:hypothetical protein